MPDKWTYALTLGFTPQITALISATPLFSIETTQQLTIGQKAQMEAMGYNIINEEQTEHA